MIRRSAITGDTVAVLQRAALQDTRLSYRATGILTAVLSRPIDWHTSAEQLARERPDAEGRDAIRTALRELETAGYLVRECTRDERGRLRTVWELSDTPLREASPGGTPQDGNSPGRNSQEASRSGSTRGRNSREEIPRDGSCQGGNSQGSSQEASQDASQGELDITAGHTGDGFPAVGLPAVGRPGLLQGVETGGRDKKPLPFPSRVVSPGAGLGEEGQGGEEVDSMVEAVVSGTGVDEERLRASVPLREAVRVLARTGVTPGALRAACEELRSWEGAGVGAVVRWVQERVRVRDLVPVQGPAMPECPEHPGHPAGRCPVCERAAVDGGRVRALADVVRAAVRSHT